MPLRECSACCRFSFALTCLRTCFLAFLAFFWACLLASTAPAIADSKSGTTASRVLPQPLLASPLAWSTRGATVALALSQRGPAAAPTADAPWLAACMKWSRDSLSSLRINSACFSALLRPNTRHTSWVQTYPGGPGPKRHIAPLVPAAYPERVDGRIEDRTHLRVGPTHLSARTDPPVSENPVCENEEGTREPRGSSHQRRDHPGRTVRQPRAEDGAQLRRPRRGDARLRRPAYRRSRAVARTTTARSSTG